MQNHNLEQVTRYVSTELIHFFFSSGISKYSWGPEVPLFFSFKCLHFWFIYKGLVPFYIFCFLGGFAKLSTAFFNYIYIMFNRLLYLFIVYYIVYHFLGIVALNSPLVLCNSYSSLLDRILFLLSFFQKTFRVEPCTFFRFCAYFQKYVCKVGLDIIRIFLLCDHRISSSLSNIRKNFVLSV